MATFLFGGAEGVLAQAPGHTLSPLCVYPAHVIAALRLPGTRYRQFAPHSAACGKAAAQICKTTPYTVELPRARARGLFLGRVCRARGRSYCTAHPLRGLGFFGMG